MHISHQPSSKRPSPSTPSNVEAGLTGRERAAATGLNLPEVKHIHHWSMSKDNASRAEFCTGCGKTPRQVYDEYRGTQ